MSDASIRPAVPGDAAAIQRVIRAAYAPWVEKLPDLPDVAGGLGDAIAGGGVSVATDGQSILGVVMIGWDAKILHLQNLAVAPSSGGQGIGSALIRHAEKQARKGGATRMRLATHAEMTGNVALYERLGWSVTGQDGAKVLMERTLT